MLASSGMSPLAAACLIGLHVSSASGAFDRLVAPRAFDETTDLDLDLDLGVMPNLDAFYETLGTTAEEDWTADMFVSEQEVVDVEGTEASNKAILSGQPLPNLDTDARQEGDKDGTCSAWTHYTWKECFNMPHCAAEMASGFGRGIFTLTGKYVQWVGLFAAAIHTTRAAYRQVFHPVKIAKREALGISVPGQVKTT